MIKSGPWKGHCGGMHCGNVAKGETAMTGCQCSCGPCDASRPMPSHDLDAVGFGFDLCVNGPPGEIRRLQRLIAAAKAVVEYEWGDPAKGCGPPKEQIIWRDLAAALRTTSAKDVKP